METNYEYYKTKYLCVEGPETNSKLENKEEITCHTYKYLYK